VRSSIYLEIKHTLRVLTRSLSYSIPAVCALAIGVGANTAVYSIVHSILLRPLPYHDADNLVQIVRQDGNSEFKVSTSDFEALKHEQDVWDDIALYQRWYVSFTGSAGPEMLRSANISTNFLDLFKVPPALGRTFYADEGQAGREAVAIISDSIWRKRFAADPSVIGRQFLFGAKSYTLVGIAPAGFSFPDTDVWFPITTWQGLTDGDKEIVARLKTRGRLREAQSAAEVVTTRLARHEARRVRTKLKVISLQEYINREVRPLTFLLFATSGFVLLLACTNVSLALISRGIEKGGEIAIRQALGAKARHVVQHVLTESVVIGLLGGALGTMIAWGGFTIFRALLDTSQNAMGPTGLDHQALGFALSISLLAGIIAGLIPAALAAKREIINRIAQLGSYVRPITSKLRIRDVILVFQISAALLLLICTGLMLRSTWALSRVDVGFDFHSALAMWTAPPQSYNQNQVKLFYQQAMEGVRTLPGISEVGITSNGLLFGMHAGIGVLPGSNSAGPTQWVEVRSVSPGLFHAAGMRLVQGRYFDDSDADISSPGQLVVDDTFAQRFWPGQNPVGNIITIPGKPATEWQVIGVVKGTRDISLREEPVPTIYRDYRHDPPHSMCLVIRTTLEPHGYARAIRDRILETDSNAPPSTAITLEELQSEPLRTLQIGSMLLGVFAAMALTLAAIGIYGAVSYTVVQRTHEIGVRIALGANRPMILRLVLGHAVKISLFGLGFGALGTFLLTSVLSGTISYLPHTDMWSYAIGSLVLAAAALTAAYVPARKAAQADPVACLRQE
jgi:putative ABC transport system permease protein